MRALLIFLLVCLFVLPSSANTCDLVRCIGGTKCVEDCSSGTCTASCVPSPAPQGQTVCDGVLCEQGQTCVIDCSSGNCEGVCQAIQVHISVCDVIRCAEGTVCVEECTLDHCFPACLPTPTIPQTLPTEPSEPEFPAACAATTCLVGSYCILGEDGEPKCVPFEEFACSSAQCPEGLQCVAHQQECLTTPCPQYSCLQPGLDLCPQKGPKVNCTDMCPMIYAPVCASNGKTYPSTCQLNVENCNNGTEFTILHQGECQEIPAPQSACDSAICEEGEICLEDPKYCITTPCPQHQCVPYESCPLVKCSSDGEKVCGSDGVTYVNECQLNQTMCRELRVIHVMHLGECSTPSSNDPCESSSCGDGEICLREPKYCITTPCPQYKCVPCDFCPEVCEKIYSPVCGEDGVSYSNECLLRTASCLERKVISIAHSGECEASVVEPQNACATVDCGDGSICLEDPKDCSQTKEGKDCDQFACYPLSKCPELCPLNYQPLCASDGKTYGNQCMLAQAICQERRVLTFVREGPCDDEINITVKEAAEMVQREAQEAGK